jgi:hypothetical protein
MVAAAFLARSQPKAAPARSLVQDSGAPAWLSTAGAPIRIDCSARMRSLRADRAVVPAYFVVARRQKARLLTPCTLLAPLAEAGAW